jgi:NitT/TauT family transport system substrate-binding protein
MKKHPRLGALAAALVLSAALSGAVLAQQPQGPLKKVTVGILYLVADAGVFIAQDRGYFAQEGIQVELSRFTSGGDVVALLATNRLDAGSGSATPGLFNSYIRGVNAPIVASKAIIARNDTGSLFLARRDLVESGKVKTTGDMKGMRIAVNNIQSTSLNYVLRAVAAGGLRKDDVTVVEMPFEQFIPAFQKKAIDAAMAFSPLANTIADRMKLAVSLPEGSTAATSPDSTANMLFYSPGFAKTDTARGFMVALMKGQRDYQRAIFDGKGDRNGTCALINKHLPFVPPDCAGISMSAVEPDSLVNVKSLEQFQDEWVQWGLMRERANIAANVNMEFVNFAIGKLGKYQK